MGKSLALGAEYEYQDYSSMKFKDTEGNSSAYEFENRKEESYPLFPEDYPMISRHILLFLQLQHPSHPI